MASEVMPADAVLIEDLCKTLEKLYKKKKLKQEQDRILGNFINDLKLNMSQVTGKKNSSLFPIMRLLLPSLERERSAYNMKESKLGDLLVKVLSLTRKSPDAMKLLNFRSVNTSQDSDFAGVAFYVLKNRIVNSGHLSIGDMNLILDKIASAEVGNKGPVLDEAFSYALKNLSAEQIKWFLRIILKDLKLGMGDSRILASFHPDAPELYKNCSNLSKVCEELEDGDNRPIELGIKIFYPLSPMLSERFDVTNVNQLPKDKTYQVEEKFDGERFQVHMQNGTFEYYSRKGHPFAKSYGINFDEGLLTPLLKDCFSASVESVILDGEMMGWHKQNQCFGTKGMAFDVKKLTESSRFRPCFVVFDVLYYNGKSLVGPQERGGVSLSERLKLLDGMFTEIPGVIQRSKRQIVTKCSDILDALNTAMENQEEGIVVKDTQSYYNPNQRNGGWYKIKAEYTEGTMTDLDLVIIGADEAENKRQGRAKSFLVACADAVVPGSAPKRWVCVGRVATGLKFDERERVCAALERHWTPRTAGAAPPPALVFNKIKPDFWIMPEHSIVLEVRATELTRSTDFGTAYTLRFPRVVRVRDDKPVNDVMTLDEFNHLAGNKGPVVKLSSKRVNDEQIVNASVKTRRRRAQAPQVAEQFRAVTLADVEVTSKALAGRKICILSDDEDCGRAELIRIVESHGGKHVANIGSDTWCCIVGRSTAYTRRVVGSRGVDAASAAWLRGLRASPTPCSLRPLDMLATARRTELALAAQYDAFGDGYKEPTDEATLRRCFHKIDADEPPIYLTTQEMLNIDAELFGENPFSFLRPCSIQPVNCSDITVLRAKMYGATVCDVPEAGLTHVVVSRKAEAEFKAAKKTCSGVLTVSEEWLETCLAQEALVSADNFLL